MSLLPTSIRRRAGFTMVELLIVIVIIGILAVITVVAYNGIQQRARDSQRSSDIAALVKALELYYIDNGRFPQSSGSTTSMGPNWSTTADPSWLNLQNQLTAYMPKPVADPISTPNVDIRLSTPNLYGYAYYSVGSTCGGGVRQTYILIYRSESFAPQNTLIGACDTAPLGPYSNVSNYRVSK